jgi:hypothetical protein
MRSRAVTTVLVLQLALAGAAVADPPRAGLAVAPPPPALTFNDNDCGVIAAVAKQHFRFGPDKPAPPLKIADGYVPKCAWESMGLAFTPWVEGGREFVSFQQPAYDSGGATINVSRVNGPLAGAGWTCRVRSGVAGWTLERCDAVWMS